MTKCDFKLRELPAKSRKTEGENTETEKLKKREAKKNPKTNTRKANGTQRVEGGTLRGRVWGWALEILEIPKWAEGCCHFGPESQTTMPRRKVNAINTRRRHIAGIMYYV